MICEFCGGEDKESLQIVLDKWACWKCYPKKKYIEFRMEESKSCRIGCTCHSCLIMYELGYEKINIVNREWSKK
jgi:hypothetical protein